MMKRAAMQSPYALSAALREATVAEYKLRAICKAAVDRFGDVSPFSDVRAAATHRADLAARGGQYDQRRRDQHRQ